MVNDVTLANQGNDFADVNLNSFNFYRMPLVVDRSQTLNNMLHFFLQVAFFHYQLSLVDASYSLNG